MSKSSWFRNTRQAWKGWRFQRSGMKPWTKGYAEYKLREIDRTLRSGEFRADNLPAGYGFRLDERIVEYPWLFSRLPLRSGTLLDAGSVLNLEFLVQHPTLKSKKLHICTLAPEGECFWQDGISYLFDDLRRLPYREEWFDWVVCLSTLEHVGLDNTFLYTKNPERKESKPQDYMAAVRELRRVLRPGGILYLSFPFGRAANHGWLQILDQRMVESVIEAFEPRGLSVDYFLYHPDGWHSSSAQEAANATFFDIHHAKGYDPDFAASARGLCCLELGK